jgi:serine/threonine protein kinase
MAPEQFLSPSAVGKQADIYALGKLFGEMLTGHAPPVGAPKIEKYPERFRDFLELCVHEEPARRFDSAGSALEMFESLFIETSWRPSVLSFKAEIDSLNTTLARIPSKEAWGSINRLEVESEIKRFLYRMRQSSADQWLMLYLIPTIPLQLHLAMSQANPADYNQLICEYASHFAGPVPEQIATSGGRLTELLSQPPSGQHRADSASNGPLTSQSVSMLIRQLIGVARLQENRDIAASVLRVLSKDAYRDLREETMKDEETASWIGAQLELNAHDDQIVSF